MTKWNVFVELFASTSSSELLDDFLLGLTTDKEREELLQRVEIVKRLMAGESQHHIASELGVGVATVTRGSKELAYGRFKILKSKNG